MSQEVLRYDWQSEEHILEFENTGRNIQLIVETSITSHTDIAYHFEHNAHGTPPHLGVNLLISVECTYVEGIIPECIVLGNMS